MAASLAALLQARGYKVRIRKFDPYLNVDPGTMSPYQHGEVYVTDDGAETDLDLGHYERFHRRRLAPVGQRHVGPHLPDDHHQGAPRRLSGRHRPGDPARHRRDQGVRAHRRRGSRLRAVRDRGHRRRHRVAAVHGGDPPAAHRSRPRQQRVRPPDFGALSGRRRRAQDQADAAQRARSYRARHPARRAGLPLRAAAAAERAREDRAVLQRPARKPSSPLSTPRASMASPANITPKDSTPKCFALSTSIPTRPHRKCANGSRSRTASPIPRAR